MSRPQQDLTRKPVGDWLRTRDAEPEHEPLPDEAGTPTGHQVLAILRKRRASTCPPPRHNFPGLPRIRPERPAFELHYPHMVERMRAEGHRRHHQAD